MPDLLARLSLIVLILFEIAATSKVRRSMGILILANRASSSLILALSISFSSLNSSFCSRSCRIISNSSIFSIKEHYHNKNASLGFSDSQYIALDGADALIICTEWNEFRTPDFEQMIKQLKAKVIFDGRNLYDTTSMSLLGFHYESIGRRKVVP